MRYVAALYAQGLAADVQALIWFTLYDLPNFSEINGLVTQAPAPKQRPAFRAFQFAAAQLRDASFSHKLGAAEAGAADMEVYAFAEAARGLDIHVAWLNPVSTTAKKPLVLAAKQAVVRDVYGVSSVVMDEDDGAADERVTVEVSGRPVYIEIAR